MGGTAISLVTIPFWSPCGRRGEGEGVSTPSLKNRSQQISVQVPNFLTFQGASEIKNEYDATEMLVWFHVLSRCAGILRHSQSGCCFFFFLKKNLQTGWIQGKKSKKVSPSKRNDTLFEKLPLTVEEQPPPPPPPDKVFFVWKTGNLTVLWLSPWKRGEGLIRVAPEKYPPSLPFFFGRNKNPWKINK